MLTQLSLITDIARKDRRCKLKNLIRFLDNEGLAECFYLLKKNKAAGVDGVTLKEYERNLDENISDLIRRMKTFSYRPQPVKRVYIPKADGKSRPLGIPAVEDKMVQMAISKILEAIYEVDFEDFSYGFRPGRSCHDALNRVDKIIMTNPINHVIDADIKGFFDNVDHKWMVKFLEHRIGDKSLIRYIVRFLKSGYMEEGKLYKNGQGTPQGGVISPILANIYLHYVLDIWIARIVKKCCRGTVEMVRYADDFVICVQYKNEAEKILEALKKRLAKFGLELAEDKTRIVEFGRFARQNAKQKGKRPGTFDFLGFTHYGDKTRKGYFKVGRVTSRKKFSAKIKDIKEWLKRIRNLVKIQEWWKILGLKLRGHYQYYGVSGNYRGLKRFYFLVIRLARKWMNRRSQKTRYYWKRYLLYLERHPLPKPKIYHNFYTLGANK
jgi:RNA-directed DNA polymerase